MTHTKSVRRITSHSLTVVEDGLTVSDKLVLYHVRSRDRDFCRGGFTNNTCPQSPISKTRPDRDIMVNREDMILLPLDSSLTQRQNVRPKRKTKHQKTNALANRRQT